MRIHRHGTTMVYSLVTMMTLLGFASLAVDLGRVEVTKTQLRAAADAAARAGAAGLKTNSATASANAISAAGQNTVDTSTLVLQAGDVVVGTWSGGTFSPGGASPNAVKVTAYHTAARGTAVPLLFAQILGFSHCDVTAQSIATYTAPGPGWGIVGLNSININHTLTIDSYDPSLGAYSAGTALQHGNAASNGGGNESSTITVDGNVGYNPSAPFNVTGSVTVTGSLIQLNPLLSYPTPSAGTYSSVNSNAGIPGSILTGTTFNMSSGTLNLNGGNYYFTSMTVTGGIINMLGPVTIYMNGGVTISGGTINTLNNKPSNFNLLNQSASAMTFSGGSALYCDINAPLSTVNYGNTNPFYGAIIAGALNVTANTLFHYDQSQGIGSGGNGIVSLVK